MSSDERRTCPSCKEKIKSRAKVCCYCGSRLVWKGRWILNWTLAIICAVVGSAFPPAFLGTIYFFLAPVFWPSPKEV